MTAGMSDSQGNKGIVMDIYGSIFSPYVARVALAARFKGIKHRISRPKDTKSAAFLKLNPLGKMPTIKDGATVVFESGVILDYLEVKSKSKRLIPAGAKAGAQARLIGAIFAEYVQPPVFPLFRQRDPSKRDQSLVDTKLAEFNRGLDVAEKMLVAKPFAAGAKFTIADCYAVPTLYYVERIGEAFGFSPFAQRKKLKRYMTRLKKEKLTAAVMKEMDVEFREWLAKA